MGRPPSPTAAVPILLAMRPVGCRAAVGIRAAVSCRIAVGGGRAPKAPGAPPLKPLGAVKSRPAEVPGGWIGASSVLRTGIDAHDWAQ